MADSSAPRVPSAWQLERAVSAWQQLRADPALAEDEEVIAATLAEAEITHPEVLLDRAIDAVIWAERREVEADELRREMVARRDRYAARAEMIRRVIEDLLTALDMRSRRARLGAASVAMGPASVTILDPQLVPDEFVRTERHILKAPIKEAIDAGHAVAGAALANPAPILRIRKL